MKTCLCLVALLLVACADDPLDVEFGDGPPIRTDATSYVVTQRDDVFEVKIAFTFENRLPQPIYLERCAGVLLPPLLERKVGDGWRTEWSAPDYCASFAFTLAPGGRYQDTLRIHAHPFGGDRKPQFTSSDVTGTHRLQWDHALRSFDADSKPPGERVPLRHRISNEFELREGP
jgi:hypothetical protein